MMKLLRRTSLLLAQSGHSDCAQQCPLSGVKRTLRGRALMSAFDPKRTLKIGDNVVGAYRYGASVFRLNHPRRDLARSIAVYPASPPTPWSRLGALEIRFQLTFTHDALVRLV